MIEPGVHRIPLSLPQLHEPRREQLEKALMDAQRRLKRFAESHGWTEHIIESFADRAKIYSTKDKFDQILKQMTETDPGIELPKTYCAALEKRVLLCVSPELYLKNYPEGAEEKAFEKLIAHEMAHRLHIRILGGNEDAMGPIWFFEGFAIYAAGQFENYELQPAEIWETIRSTTRGNYKKYGAVLRYFLKKASVHELIEHAGDEEFLNWLQKIESR